MLWSWTWKTSVAKLTICHMTWRGSDRSYTCIDYMHSIFHNLFHISVDSVRGQNEEAIIHASMFRLIRWSSRSVSRIIITGVISGLFFCSVQAIIFTTGIHDIHDAGECIGAKNDKLWVPSSLSRMWILSLLPSTCTLRELVLFGNRVAESKHFSSRDWLVM